MVTCGWRLHRTLPSENDMTTPQRLPYRMTSLWPKRQNCRFLLICKEHFLQRQNIVQKILYTLLVIVNVTDHLLTSPIHFSTQKTHLRSRSWPSTSLMYFWLRKTLKSRSFSRRIKVIQRINSLTLCILLVDVVNSFNPCLCRTMAVSWRASIHTRVNHGSVP